MPNTSQHNGWAEWQAKRGNRHQRGYGSEWDKIREQVIKRDNHLCQEHLRQGVLLEVVTGNPRHPRAANVDHIIPRAQGGSDDGSNLELLCKTCHDRKTNRESLVAKGITPKAEIGEDGWPVAR